MLKFGAEYSYIGCKKGSKIDPHEVNIITLTPEDSGWIVIRKDSLLTAGRGLALWLSSDEMNENMAQIVENVKAGETDAALQLTEQITDDTFKVVRGPQAKIYSFFRGLDKPSGYPFFAGEFTVSPSDTLEFLPDEAINI
jgi:hypothetical protein